jgi:predicted nucleotidyltransferase
MTIPTIPHLSSHEKSAVATYINTIRDQFQDQIIAVALIGSKARGDDDPESDIDLIVIVKSEADGFRSKLWKIASEISLENNVLISPRIFSQDRWEKTRELGLPFSKIILEENIKLTPEGIPT